MSVSWAQHDTVVERRSKDLVRQLVSSLGRGRSFTAREAELFEGTDRAALVEAGAVDLFVTELDGDEPVGRRAHLTRIEQGELMLGVARLQLPSGRTFAVLAVGLSETRITETDRTSLEDAARRTGRTEELLGLVDVWVRRLSEQLTKVPVPDEARELLPGRRTTLEAGSFAGSAHKTVWVQVLSGQVSLVGRSDIRPARRSVFYPLTRASWVVADVPTELRVLSAKAFFEIEHELDAIDPFGQVALHCAVRELGADEQLVRERSEVRQDLIAERLGYTFRNLAVLSPAPEEPPRAQKGSPSPLALVLERIGKQEGFRVVIPPDPRAAEQLEVVARSSRIRTRSVLLEPGWPQRGHLPMVAFAGDRTLPVALLPQPSGGYLMYDPLSGAEVDASASVVEALDPMAYEIYAPLPAGPVGPWSLFRSSVRGGGRDLAKVVVAGVLGGVLALASPLAFGALVDEVIPAARVSALAQLVFALAAAAFVSSIAGASLTLALLRLEARGSARAQSGVWDRLLALPPAFFRGYASGDLADRANGIDALRRSLSAGFVQATLAGFFALGSFVLLLGFDVGLGLTAAGLGVVEVALLLGVGLRVLRLRRGVEDAEGKMTGLSLQFLNGLAKLRVAGAEGLAFTEWARHLSTRRDLQLAAETTQERLGVLNTIYPQLCTLVLFAWVGSLPFAGGSAGDFVAFYSAFTIFMNGLIGLGGVILDAVGQWPLYERARPLLRAEAEVDPTKAHPGTLHGHIELSKLTFRYLPQTPPVLSSLDLEIRPGELLALVGESGSGKSTLLRILLGFETPESGGVFYDGQDLSTLDLQQVRSQLGVVLQNGEISPGEMYQCIVGSRKLGLEEAWAAAEMAGLAEDIRRMPMQMHTMVGQGGTTLSGGQRQRLMIARAVVHRPRILLLDEATSALDGATQEAVVKALEGLHATRVVVAHRLSTVVNADRIVVLDRGRIVQSGTYEDLISAEGLFRELAARQRMT